jgi:hypothetical protein
MSTDLTAYDALITHPRRRTVSGARIAPGASPMGTRCYHCLHQRDCLRDSDFVVFATAGEHRDHRGAADAYAAFGAYP